MPQVDPNNSNLNLNDPSQIALMSLTLALQEAVTSKVINEVIGAALLNRAEDIRLALVGGAQLQVIEGMVHINPRKARTLAEILGDMGVTPNENVEVMDNDGDFDDLPGTGPKSASPEAPANAA